MLSTCIIDLKFYFILQLPVEEDIDLSDVELDDLDDKDELWGGHIVGQGHSSMCT